MLEEKFATEHVEEGKGSDDASDQLASESPAIDPVAEAKVRRKIDLYIMPVASLMYLFCFIDRANIGNARLAGLETDLGLVNYDYNILLSVFYISYIIFEIPSNMACKALGPGWFLPGLTLGFGILSICTGFVHNLSQACAVRFLLGIFEAGVMPGIAYYLSRWYRRGELAFRISIYMVMSPLAGAFGGLLASGILKLSHFGSLTAWRMIFAIEGIVTIFIALFAFVTLTDRPETARWLSQEEKNLAIARIQSESAHLVSSHVLDKLDTKKTLRGIFNPVTLATSWLMLLANITVQGLAFFLPTIVKTIYPNETVIFQQLYTVPPYIVGGFFTLLIPYLSSRFNHRSLYFVITPPLMMTGYIMFLASSNPRVRYGATFLVGSGSFPIGILCNAHSAANVVSDTARASAIGMVVMMGNVGGLISTWSFLPFDGPDYHIGNGLNLAGGATTLLTAVGLWVWAVRDNRRRDGKDVQGQLDGLSERQVEDLEWRHPGFRWRL